MNLLKKIVLISAAFLILIWFGLNASRISEATENVVSLILGTVLAAAVLIRRKPILPRPVWHAGILAAIAAVGFVNVVGFGMIMGVHQIEWLGILMIMFACLAWALPPYARGDILGALFILYWIHPLPAQFFGPTQLFMQKLSVRGTEWLLHIWSTPVWVDGLTLKTGFREFGVPEACSGMRTAVTVFLSGIGAGIMMRFGWRWTLLLTVLGFVEVVVLNVIRIALMVGLAGDRPSAWADTFLHDSLGGFLLASIVLINLQAAALAMMKLRREHGMTLLPAPLFIRKSRTLHRVLLALFLIVLVGVAAFMLRHRRPVFRAAIYMQVAEQYLQANDRVNANGAMQAAVWADPGNTRYRLQLVDLLLRRGHVREALAGLDWTPPADQRTEHTVLLARALARSGNRKDFDQVIDALPADVRTQPGVALALAEAAAAQKLPEQVAKYIEQAARDPSNAEAVRELFPFLAVIERWDLIISCNGPLLPQRPELAMLVADANLRKSRVQEAEQILRAATRAWPQDQKLLSYLTSVASRRGELVWDDILKDNVNFLMHVEADSSSAAKTRDLFPYLAARQQWPVIARYRIEFGFDTPQQALLVAIAKLRVNDMVGSEAIIRLGLERWPTDVGLLVCASDLIVREPNDNREEWFEKSFRNRLPTLGADGISSMLDNLFVCGRPDLAWEAMARLRQVDARHPALYMAMARHAGRWFTFRSDYAALAGKIQTKFFDASTFYRERFSWPEAPLATDILAAAPDVLRRRLAARCAEDLKPVIDSGRADARQKRLYDEAMLLQKSGGVPVLEAVAPAGIGGEGAEALGAGIRASFERGRPDLAWAAYAKLKALNPADPELLLTPARYADVWFSFDNAYVGLPAALQGGRTSLGTLYRRSENWARGVEAPQIGLATQYLAQSLSEIDARFAGSATGSVQMAKMALECLMMLRDYPKAIARIDEMALKFPEERGGLLLKKAMLLEQLERWDDAYETAGEYQRMVGNEDLAASTIRIRSLLRIGMHAYALWETDQALRRFPGAPGLNELQALVLLARGCPEDALFAADLEAGAKRSPILPELLDRTGRFDEAGRIRQMLGIREPARAPLRQPVVLPKAELTIEPHYPQKLTTVELTMEADRARQRAEKTRSPYLRALHTLTAEWFRTGGAADASKPALWMAAGRTAAEKSAALVELIGLQAQQGRLDEARAMCDRIVDTLPGAAVIWREYVALSGGDPKVVARARTACPTDSDIWLASLVLRVKDKPDAAALNSEIEAAARKRLYPAGAFVRAGDLLRRQKLVKPASAAARYAIANGRGLVPAYLLGFLCGVDAGELDWAFSCAVNGADAATDPWPFLKAAAEIARRRGDTGESTVAVLRRLVAQYPQEPVWRSRLAGLLIRREQPEEAVDILRPVLSNTNGGAAFDIVVAEALRGVGQTDQAVVLLRRGLLAHPENEALANNLAFALSLSSNGQGEALQMVEQRLARQTNSLAAMDTAAFVNLRAGKSSQALPFLKNVVKLLASTDARWLAANPGVVSVADVGMVSSMKTLEDDPAVKKEIELIRAAIVARLSSTSAGR